MSDNATSTSTWIGTVPVDDTALAVTDTGGSGRPIVYLNGSYASQRHWRRVIADLGPGYRHITFDERARGRSKRSADYSFEACLRDIDAVLAARGVHQPLLVGWSYGALLGVYWADRHPDRALGVVGVDGPYPSGWTDEAGRERLRKTFRRMRPLLPLVAPLGLAARMSADQHAEIQIEAHALHAALGPLLDRAALPVRYVAASAETVYDKGGELEQMRRTLDPYLARNPNLKISARVASDHGKILRNDSPAVADAVREVAALLDDEAR
ncbi:pimeloyl-ACP methyl ester carboxylesterase [Nocardia transvalensis]|uniref:Pimeloyl-ACP methyl ester carboxylesterase n=1 Tax=Nocardia transvalensis TaxID=37333 RepID=A0A7W9PJ44_9NOCA|nr:alpha/beta fold hydrolase [Nocardia transvalensis]MBB5917022.1 pimeloyl-ACP methyl ester carboxylesterase [Nocardia transvalensis]